MTQVRRISIAKIASLTLALGSCALMSTAADRFENFTPSVQGKKLIGSGIAYRSGAFVLKNVEELEKLPFDGMIVGRFWPFWKGTKNTSLADPKTPRDEMIKDPEEPLDSFLADVRAAKFKKFTDNFMGVESSHEGAFDWFDEARCAEMIGNWGRLAAVAKEAGLKGMQFDAEGYHGKDLFNYERGSAGSRRACEARVEDIGARVMREVNKHYPDMTLLLYFGHSGSWQTLMIPFLDGMLSEAKPGFVMVDGYEDAYGFRDNAQFASARAEMRKRSAQATYYRPEYKRHARVGFPVWPCNWHGKPPERRSFDTENFSANHYTPDELAYVTQCALSYSDKYVWVWSESLNPWNGTVRVYDQSGKTVTKPIPQEYLDALERGKKGGVPVPPARDYSKINTTP